PDAERAARVDDRAVTELPGPVAAPARERPGRMPAAGVGESAVDCSPIGVASNPRHGSRSEGARSELAEVVVAPTPGRAIVSHRAAMISADAHGGPARLRAHLDRHSLIGRRGPVRADLAVEVPAPARERPADCDSTRMGPARGDGRPRAAATHPDRIEGRNDGAVSQLAAAVVAPAEEGPASA